MFKLFGAIWALICSGFNNLTLGIRKKPAVMAATFDNIIQQKDANLKEYESAIAGKGVVLETKKVALAKAQAMLTALTRQMQAAGANAKKMLDGQFGGDETKANANIDYVKVHTAFTDKFTSMKKVQTNVAELTGDVDRIGKEYEELKFKWMELKKDRDSTAEKKSDSISKVLSAEQEKRANNRILNLSTDRTSAAEKELDDMVNQTVAEAKVSRELAGTDTHIEDAKLMETADQLEAEEAFRQQMGIAAAPVAVASSTETAVAAKLPES